ncbi:hypothetical protein M885DRAFT_16336 [Pelagophyceae sp. CCMP2097]|nr:hypothetical protein M885DRAFT_16336 [Pelagophyceae sp. CCMP2097]
MHSPVATRRVGAGHGSTVQRPVERPRTVLCRKAAQRPGARRYDHPPHQPSHRGAASHAQDSTAKAPPSKILIHSKSPIVFLHFASSAIRRSLCGPGRAERRRGQSARPKGRGAARAAPMLHLREGPGYGVPNQRAGFHRLWFPKGAHRREQDDDDNQDDDDDATVPFADVALVFDGIPLGYYLVFLRHRFRGWPPAALRDG